VIRLAVMMYLPSPLSLRNVKDILFERGDRHLSWNGAVLAEQIWPHVRQRHAPAAGVADAVPSGIGAASLPRRT